MNLLEVIEASNGKPYGKCFIRKSEPNLIYRVGTRSENHSGAIFEYVDLWLDEQKGPYQEGKGYVALTLPRILADDWELWKVNE